MTGTGLPQRFITAVKTKRNDSTGNIAYVTFSGFSGNNPNFADNLGHVFKTTNGGVTWTDFSGNLPNVPVNDLVVDHEGQPTHDALYVATDVGVFTCQTPETSNCTTWTVVGAGSLPAVVVHSLFLRGESRNLMAGTHGRSAWNIQLTDVAPPPNGLLLTSIFPASATAGAAAFTMTLDGGSTGGIFPTAPFTNNTQVLWNGSSVGVTSVTLVSPSRLTALISAANIAQGGTANVSVSDPGATPNTSDTLIFTIINPAASPATIDTVTATVGVPLTVNIGGTNFVPGIDAIFNNTVSLVHNTTGTVSGGGTLLTVTLPGSTFVVPTTSASLAVSNPPPGGGSIPGAFPFTVLANSGPAVLFNPFNVNFGNQSVGTTGPVTNVTMTNGGSAQLSWIGITLTGTNPGDFTLGAPTAGVACNLVASNLAVGASCAFGVAFKPTAGGTRTANVNVADNTTSTPHTVPLSGTGQVAAPTVTLNPTSVNFGSQNVGTTSAVTNVTLTNTGNATLNLTSIALGGADAAQFSLLSQANGATPACPLGASTLNAGSPCNFAVQFAPTTIGAKSASVSIADNAAGNPHIVSLTGTGTGVASGTLTLNPTSANFGSVALGTTSPVMTATLSNTGAVTVTINTIQSGGANPGDFVQAPFAAGDCAPALVLSTSGAGSSCNLRGSFAPTATGPRSATVTTTSTAANSPHVLSLTGTGTQPALAFNPTNVPFGNVVVNQQSGVTNLQISNTGTATLNFTGGGNAAITLTGANANQFALLAPTAGTDCRTVATLSAGSSCNVGTRFAPTSLGLKNASVNVVDDAPGSPHTAPLSGTGVQPGINFAPAAVPFGNVVVGGSSAATHVHISNNGTSTLNITSIALTGADLGQFNLTSAADGATPACPLGASPLAAGNTCNVDAKFAPTSTGAKNANLSVTDDAPGSPHSVPLSGTGVAPAIGFSPTAVNFSNVVVGGQSAVTNVQVSNTGTATLNLTSITLIGTDANQFALVAPTAGTPCNVAGGPVLAGSSCNFGVQFKPTLSGAKSASVSVADDVPGSPQTVPLTGTGTASTVVFNPSSVSFSSQRVGTTSAVTHVHITNGGTATLNISSIALTGAGAAQFTLTSAADGTTPACLLGAGNLAPNNMCNVDAKFGPTSTGPKSASVTVADDAAGNPHNVPLTGTGIAPAVTLNPTNVPFGNVLVGTISGITNVQLTNSGSDTLNLTSITLMGADAAQFSLVAPSGGATPACPTGAGTVNATSSCFFGVQFAPTAAGAKSASVSIADDATPSPQSVPLTGTGFIAPKVTLNPTSVNFGNQRTGTTSAVTNVMLSNTGNDVLNITSIGLIGTDAAQFNLLSQANGAIPACPLAASALNAGSSCNFALRFAPTTTGGKSASATITDNATGNPHSVPLSGTGTAPAVTLAPTNVAFGGQNITTTSAVTNVTLTNSGTATLNLASITLGGTDAAQFRLLSQANGATPACPLGASALNPNGACNFAVQFAPTAAGAKSASVSIADDATGSPHTLPLTGSGTQPAVTLSTASVPFGSVNVGDTKAASPAVTLTSSGTGPLTINSIGLTGADAAQFTLANTCGTLPATIPASGTCTITPSFKPTSTGAKNASVSIADNAPGNPHIVALNGMAVDFALAVPTATATVTAGQSASFTINVSTAGGPTANAITFSPSGNPAATTVTFNPTSIPAGSATGTTTMTVATTVRGAVPPQGPSHPAGPRPLPLLLGLTAALAALASLALLRQGARTRRWALYLPLALLALALAGVMGCSGVKMATGTPAGTSTITVTASSGGVAKTTTVTLTVN